MEKLFEKLSNKELEERIKIMAEKMVTGGSKNDSRVAYGVVISYIWLTSELNERIRKKNEVEGKPPHNPIFCFKVPNYG